MALAALVSVTITCGDDAPVGVPEPCVGSCVDAVFVDFEDVILTPGDTIRLRAVARSANGTDSGVRWSAQSALVTVDSAGLVTATREGKTAVVARPRVDSAKIGVAEIWVVHPDTGGQPFLTAFRDARTHELITRFNGFAGRDSISATVTYVLGNARATDGEPEIVLQIRRAGSSVALRSWTFPLLVRGRGAQFDVKLFLTERDPQGQRLLPSGAYDLYVLLPLANGQVLGDQTGYGVSF
jgi:hypothetical protein